VEVTALVNSLLRTSNRKPEKRSYRSFSLTIPAWAQVALLIWMACFGVQRLPIQSSHDPYGEYIAAGSALNRVHGKGQDGLTASKPQRGGNPWERLPFNRLPKEAQSESCGRAERARASQMQGTGGVEAVYNSANGYNCSTLNDVYGNEVFSFITYSGGYNFSWNPVYCTAYGPMYSTTPTPVNGVYILGTLLNYRGHYVDGIGSYHFGENEYLYQSGTWQKPDPLGHAVNPGLYLAFNGDAVNQFDPTGRFSTQVGNAVANTALNYASWSVSQELQQANQGQKIYDSFTSGNYQTALNQYAPTLAASVLGTITVEAKPIGVLAKGLFNAARQEVAPIAARGGFVTPGQYDGVRQLSQMLRDAGVPRQARLDAINSFQPGSIVSRTAAGGENVIRFHSGGVAPLFGNESQPLGRFVTPGFPASGDALSGLALPNFPGGVTQFNLRQGATFFEGTVAPNFGKPGGGIQYFVPNLSDLVP